MNQLCHRLQLISDRNSLRKLAEDISRVAQTISLIVNYFSRLEWFSFLLSFRLVCLKRETGRWAEIRYDLYCVIPILNWMFFMLTALCCVERRLWVSFSEFQVISVIQTNLFHHSKVFIFNLRHFLNKLFAFDRIMWCWNIYSHLEPSK